MSILDADKEARAEKVVQQIDAVNEAKGIAISILNDFKRATMSEEERKKQVEQDNRDLFGE